MKRVPIYLFLLGLLILSCSREKTLEEHLSRGMELYHDSSFVMALSEFTTVINMDNKNPKAFYSKGLCELRLQKYQDALLSFQSALALDSASVPALLERAKLKIVLEDYTSAINDCDRASKIQQNNPEIYVIRGIAYEKTDNSDKAIEAYETAIKYGQNDGATYYKLGVLKLNNREEACALLSKAGELGYMEAYVMIKKNCNPRFKETSNSENKAKDKKPQTVFDQFFNNGNKQLKDLPDPNGASQTSGNRITKTKGKNALFATYGSDIPDLKIGSVFTHIKSNYTLKGISSKTDEHLYKYNNSISTTVFGRKVDYLIAIVKQNVVVGYIYFLFPKLGEFGPPKDMADRFEAETGFKLGKSGDAYGAVIDDFKVIISRLNDENLGGDRIMVRVSNI